MYIPTSSLASSAPAGKSRVDRYYQHDRHDKKCEFDGDFSKYIGQIMTGIEFNAIFKNRKFVKFTCQTEKHNGFQFNTGYNVDTVPFKPDGECTPGGLYFCDYVNNGGEWTAYRNTVCQYYRIVTIPNDHETVVYFEEDKMKANRFILSERKPIWDCEELCTMAINYHGMDLVGVITNPTDTLFSVIVQALNSSLAYFEIIERNPLFLKCIPEHQRTSQLCEFAISSNPVMMQYVKDQSIIDFKKALDKTQNFTVAIPFVDPHHLTLGMCERAERLGIKLTPAQVSKKSELQQKRARLTGMVAFVGTCAVVTGIVIGANVLKNRAHKAHKVPCTRS